jgi:hypothetical protein
MKSMNVNKDDSNVATLRSIKIELKKNKNESIVTPDQKLRLFYNGMAAILEFAWPRD